MCGEVEKYFPFPDILPFLLDKFRRNIANFILTQDGKAFIILR